MKKEERSLEEQLQEMFVHYSISREEWLRFVAYLLVPENTKGYEIDQIIHTCVKIGIYNVQKVFQTVTVPIPLHPKKDVHNQYQWVVKNINTYDPDEEWTVGEQVEGSTFLFYFKRKK